MTEEMKPIDYLMTYGWMILVAAIIGGSIWITVQDNPKPQPKFNQSKVLDVVDRGVRGDCSWEEENTIDCVQSFEWKNQSYEVHDRIDVEMKNGTVQINR